MEQEEVLNEELERLRGVEKEAADLIRQHELNKERIADREQELVEVVLDPPTCSIVHEWTTFWQLKKSIQDDTILQPTTTVEELEQCKEEAEAIYGEMKTKLESLEKEDSTLRKKEAELHDQQSQITTYRAEVGLPGSSS